MTTDSDYRRNTVPPIKTVSIGAIEAALSDALVKLTGYAYVVDIRKLAVEADPLMLSHSVSIEMTLKSPPSPRSLDDLLTPAS